MTDRVIVRLLLALLFLMVALWPAPVRADEPNRAGLVIGFDEGRVETRCIAFEEDSISGDQLLARAGLDLILDTSGSMGLTVCRIEGLGCDFPGQHCFCQCMGGGDCAYWNYFYRPPGAETWTYSPLGAGLRKVEPGTVEAWVWGDGRTPPADELTFEAICSPPTPTPLPTARIEASTETPPPTAAATEIAAATSAGAMATSLPVATATATANPPQPTPTPAQAGGGLVDYWPFGLMLLVLAGLGAWVWLQRR
ncbi:MAG: hypothetical protein PVF47_12140 [Anaerolineae bacterium]|jgi:hypothetical protein